VADPTRWTIWISLAAYACAVGLMLRRRAGESPSQNRARLAWSAGCLFLWLHIAAAFHGHHGWSHAAAVAHTARETAAVTGIDWGGGIYFNYATMLLWAADVGWWWIAAAGRARRSPFIDVFLHVWLAFMIVNATIVFESGMVRWGAVAAGVVLAALAVQRKVGAIQSEISDR
jgi:hypothetical protein